MVGDKARAFYDKEAKERQKIAIQERDEKGRAKSTPGKVTGSGSDARQFCWGNFTRTKGSNT